jgi:hypothetical protein
VACEPFAKTILQLAQSSGFSYWDQHQVEKVRELVNLNDGLDLGVGAVGREV